MDKKLSPWVSTIIERVNTTPQSAQRDSNIPLQSDNTEKIETIPNSTARYFCLNQVNSAVNLTKTKTLIPFSRKVFRNKFLHSHQALSTVTSVFMLLLMFAAITGLVAASFNYNYSLNQQMKNDKERAQEQIAITQIGIRNIRDITNITVTNIGKIEVKIRALYREEADRIQFLIDPSTSIAPSRNATVNITSLGLTDNPNAVFIAATERGVISKGVNEQSITREQNPSGVDTSGLTIGPLMLTFNSLNWARVNGGGNVQGDWLQTWTIPTGSCSWRLNLTNLDTENRSLTVNQYSGFTTSLVSSPVTTTWYLKATQQTVGWNQTEIITFLWDSSRSSPATAGSNSKGVNNVFLTLLGNFSDGETFAQTIPFEAVTIE